MSEAEDDSDPLEWLEEKEQRIMDAVLEIIEAGISDRELVERVIGAVLEEIDQWGLEREALKRVPTGGKPN